MAVKSNYSIIVLFALIVPSGTHSLSLSRGLIFEIFAFTLTEGVFP